ncbi:MAG: hypothetical protein JW863_18465 [Chitinispirillaceae bacterium]|nr:hypothetical protein [Chitinispirillaceae bacterium]
MKTKCLLTVLFAVSAIQHSEADAPQQRVAVYKIKSEVLPDEFTETLTDRIESRLLQYKKYRVISRSNLDVLITEDHLSQSGLTGEEVRLVNTGSRSSVDKICTGSISRIGRSYSFTLKMIDVESARIDASAQKIYSGPAEGLLEIASGLLSRITSENSKSKSHAAMDSSSMTQKDTGTVKTPEPIVSTFNPKEGQQNNSITLQPVAAKERSDAQKPVPAKASSPQRPSGLAGKISIGAVMIFGTLAALVLFSRNQ